MWSRGGIIMDVSVHAHIQQAMQIEPCIYLTFPLFGCMTLRYGFPMESHRIPEAIPRDSFRGIIIKYYCASEEA